MNVLQAIVLGITQGLTEFLPISSSAHLLLVPYFFHWPDPGLSFDVALHWGTLLAVVVLFAKDYRDYFFGFMRSVPKIFKNLILTQAEKLSWFLLLGSVPAAVVGFLVQEQVETTLRSPLVTVFTLAGFGFLLWLADHKYKPALFEGPTSQGSAFFSLTSLKAFVIGCGQALAIVPGVSRSGITITAGLFTGLNREEATKFSFLLSGPIIFGAGLVALRHLDGINAPLIAGFFSSAVAGAFAIKFLLRFVSKNNFSIFIWYRYLLAVIILTFIFAK